MDIVPYCTDTLEFTFHVSTALFNHRSSAYFIVVCGQSMKLPGDS